MFHYNLTIITHTLHKGVCKCMLISRQFLLRMRNTSYELVQKIKTHLSVLILFFGNRTLYDVKGKKFIERGRPQMTIWRMRIACWITKSTNTHSEYEILMAFPVQTMVARRRLIVTLYVHRLYCCAVHQFLQEITRTVPPVL